MRAMILFVFLCLFCSQALAGESCPLGEVVTVDGAACTVTTCATSPGLAHCGITHCETDDLPVACCTTGGITSCSAGAIALMVEQEVYDEPSEDPSIWDEVGIPWWTILWREVVPEATQDPRHITAESERTDTAISFDYQDGTSWVTIEGEVSGGLYSPVYVAGGNSNGSSGQDCTGPDDTRCFGALTLAWGNAYSNASGPGAFVLTSTDGSVRLACDRSDVGPVGMAVHDCTTAWSTGAVWSAPTDCDGPQGANLGECIGYAYTQSH